MKLSRITKVNPRDIWKHEAHDFTQWLAKDENIEIENKTGGLYSQYAYDIKGATKNNIVYPSYDPCIFEVKYPDTDIVGRVTSL